MSEQERRCDVPVRIPGVGWVERCQLEQGHRGEHCWDGRWGQEGRGTVTVTLEWDSQ